MSAAFRMPIYVYVLRKGLHTLVLLQEDRFLEYSQSTVQKVDYDLTSKFLLGLTE